MRASDEVLLLRVEYRTTRGISPRFYTHERGDEPVRAREEQRRRGSVVAHRSDRISRPHVATALQLMTILASIPELIEGHQCALLAWSLMRTKQLWAFK